MVCGYRIRNEPCSPSEPGILNNDGVFKCPWRVKEQEVMIVPRRKVVSPVLNSSWLRSRMSARGVVVLVEYSS